MSKKKAGKTQSEDPASKDTRSMDPPSEKGASKEKGSKKKRIIIIAVGAALLILGAAGGLLFWKMKAGKGHEEAPKAETHEPEPVVAVEEDPALKTIVALTPFRLPLKDDMGTWELRLSLSLDAASLEVKEEIEARQAEIRETLTPIFQARKPSELQGVDNKIALKTQLIMAINSLLKSGKIKNLYLTEFFVM